MLFYDPKKDSFQTGNKRTSSGFQQNVCLDDLAALLVFIESKEFSFLDPQFKEIGFGRTGKGPRPKTKIPSFFVDPKRAGWVSL